MDNREIKNAQISGTMLGYEDHGILTCFIYLDYDGGGQGFGGYSLDMPTFAKGVEPRKFLDRVGTAYGMEFVIKILKAVGVEKWEDLKGEHVRVDAEWTKIHGIGHIIKDQWFYPEKDMADFKFKDEVGTSPPLKEP